MRVGLLICIAVSSLLLSLGIYLGYLNSALAVAILSVLFGRNVGAIKDYVDSLRLFVIIFSQNISVSLLSITLGPLLGVYPVLTLLINGFIIGGVVRLLADKIGPIYAVLGLVPHGIFEIPAYLYSTSIGIYLALNGLKHRFRGEEYKKLYLLSLKKGLKVIVPLLFVAALVEVYITPRLLPT